MLILLDYSNNTQLTQNYLDDLYSSIDFIINNQLKYNITDDIIDDLLLIKKDDKLDSLIKDFNN